MATLNDTYTDVIEMAYTDSTYTTPQFLRDVHTIAQDIWDSVVNMRRGEENWDVWYTNTVALQDEYRRPIASAIQIGCAYIETLAITYDSSTHTATQNKKFVLCRKAVDEEM